MIKLILKKSLKRNRYLTNGHFICIFALSKNNTNKKNKIDGNTILNNIINYYNNAKKLLDFYEQPNEKFFKIIQKRFCWDM